MVVSAMSCSTTLFSNGFSSDSFASLSCSTSTRAACHADQWPDTSAHNDSAETYCTDDTHPVAIDTGIIAIQKMVSQPLMERMKLGSPCTDAHIDFIGPIKSAYPLNSKGNVGAQVVGFVHV